MSHSLGMTWTNTATYDWEVKDHAFNALIGMEVYQYSGTYLSAGTGTLREGFDDWIMLMLQTVQHRVQTMVCRLTDILRMKAAQFLTSDVLDGTGKKHI